MNDRGSSASSTAKRARVRGTPKGRRADPKAREEVRALLKDAPLRRDLLIEYLHRIQDRYGHLSAAHLVALAEEMKLAMTEVYEVATFYHHFDVIKDGEAPPPAITVRVCDSIACDIATASPDGTRHRSSRISGMPPTRGATTGVPHASASRITLGIPSDRLDSTNTPAARYQSGNSSRRRGPSSCTCCERLQGW